MLCFRFVKYVPNLLSDVMGRGFEIFLDLEASNELRNKEVRSRVYGLGLSDAICMCGTLLWYQQVAASICFIGHVGTYLGSPISGTSCVS